MKIAVEQEVTVETVAISRFRAAKRAVEILDYQDIEAVKVVSVRRKPEEGWEPGGSAVWLVEVEIFEGDLEEEM